MNYIHIEVPALKVSELTEEKILGESSKTIRERVIKTRDIQLDRFKDITLHRMKIYTNSQMNSRMTKKYCQLDSDGRQLLRNAIERFGLSARAYDRVLKVARTIADLNGKNDIEPQHLAEALQCRSMDRML